MRGLGCRKRQHLCALFPNSAFYCCFWENTRWGEWPVGPHGMLLRDWHHTHRQNEKSKGLLVGRFWCFQVKEISDIPHRRVPVFLTLINQFRFFSQVRLSKTADLSLLILTQLVGTWSSNVLVTCPWSSPIIRSNHHNLFLTSWSFGEEINRLSHPRISGFDYHK